MRTLVSDKSEILSATNHYPLYFCYKFKMVSLLINTKFLFRLSKIVQWVSGHLPTVFSVRGGEAPAGEGETQPGEGKPPFLPAAPYEG